MLTAGLQALPAHLQHGREAEKTARICVVLQGPPICVLGSCEDVAVGLQPSGDKKYRLKNMYHHSPLSDSDRCRLMVHLFLIQVSLGAKWSSLTLCAGSECSMRVQVCKPQLAGMPAK